MKFEVFYCKSFPGMTTPERVLCSDYKEIGLVEAEGLEDLFRKMNVVDGDELPVTLKCRSMSVGDLAVDEKGEAHYCGSFGWTTVKVRI